METGAQTLGRARELALSLSTFRKLAIANAVMLVVIVATGATVRLTGSGLGCEHWPGCAPNQPFPERGFHSYIEFSNRVIAFLTICVTLATWIASRFAPVSRRLRRLALAIFLGTLAQAPLGAITVHYHLNPWLVRSRSRHVRVGLVVLGLLAVQMVIGEIQYRTRLPWWLVLVHVTMAATIWASVVAFVYGIRRPRMVR